MRRTRTILSAAIVAALLTLIATPATQANGIDTAPANVGIDTPTCAPPSCSTSIPPSSPNPPPSHR